MSRINATIILSVLILLGIVPAINSCTEAKKQAEAQQVSSGIAGPALDSLFMTIFPNDEPGGVVMVMQNDSIIYNRSFGLADLEKEVPITDSTLFNIASASKLFSGAALIKLAEQGKISLDDSLSKYFPEFYGDFFKHITIRNILTQSSGLPDLRPRNGSEWNKYLLSHTSVFLYGKDYTLYGKEDEHMKVFQNLEFTEFAPGTHYQRHDPAFILVAPLVERVTGTDFDTWMAENIFKPSEMNEAYYYSGEEKLEPMAHGYIEADPNSKPKTYRSDNGKWDEFDFGEAPFFLTKADRGLYTSARDFMRWKSALYSQKILTDSSIASMQVEYIPTDIPGVGYGLGLGVYNKPGMPTKRYHLSSNGGFSVLACTWPAVNLHYLVFSNRIDWDRRAVNKAVDSILVDKGFFNEWKQAHK